MRFWITSLFIVFALWWLWGCDLMGYHSIGQFPSRLIAQRTALNHLANHYWFVGLFSDRYQIIYQYPKNDSWRNEGMWYDKGQNELGLETDVGSGPVMLEGKIAHSELRKLEALTYQGILVDSASKHLLAPMVKP